VSVSWLDERVVYGCWSDCIDEVQQCKRVGDVCISETTDLRRLTSNSQLDRHTDADIYTYSPEMKGPRKIRRVSWTPKKTNQWVLNKLA